MTIVRINKDNGKKYVFPERHNGHLGEGLILVYFFHSLEVVSSKENLKTL